MSARTVPAVFAGIMLSMVSPSCRSSRNVVDDKSIKTVVAAESSAEAATAMWMADAGEWEAEVEEIIELTAEADTPGIAGIRHKPSAVVRKVRRVVGRARGRSAVVEEAASVARDTLRVSGHSQRKEHSEHTRSVAFPGKIVWLISAFVAVALAAMLIIRKFRKS